MNNFQKLILITGVWIFAIGVLLHSFTGRYRLPILDDEYAKQGEHAMTFYAARFDTWTGKLETTRVILKDAKNYLGEIKQKLIWVETPTCWVKDLK